MSDEMRSEFLAQPHVGVLATLRRNGLPYTVPVWWLWHEDAFWISGTTTRMWCRQLQHDPRASLCIEAMTPHPGHVGVDGPVEVHLAEEYDIWPISRLLAEKYVGRSDPANDAAVDAFFANMQTEPRMLFSLRPRDDRNGMRAIDMSVYEGKKADRKFQQDRPT
jgi:PPOX class probable F420-dependent enzyme